jgi:integrase
MPRPNLGPRLVAIRNAGWTQATYYIVWTEAGRRRKASTGHQDPGRAQEAFEAWLAERHRRRAARSGDPAAVLVSDVLRGYSEDHGGEVASPDTIKHLVQPLAYFFHGDTIEALTSGRVKEYWTWRRTNTVRTTADGTLEEVPRGVSDGTIIRELAGTLRPAIRHAVQQKRLQPGDYHVPVPQAPRGRDFWITRAQAAALLREARKSPQGRLHLPLYILVALYSGQRRGAILDLKWRQVDLVAGVIDFNPPSRLQTNKRRPIIPVPRSLLAALRRAHKRAASEHVIAYRGERVADVKTGFNGAAARADIPDCTSHTLRHTAGTWMAQRGVPMWQISGYLGHSVARTTELYAHHHPDYLSEARAAMERKS